MSIAQSLLPEIEHEASNTRRVLAAVPFDHASFKPHPKSMSLVALASHVAMLTELGTAILTRPNIDITAPDFGARTQQPIASTEDLLAVFEACMGAFRSTVESASDADMMTPWSMLAGEHTMFTLPRVAALRSAVLNHIVHHRAQLGVYLRLLDVPVPGIYGPTADDVPVAEATA